MPYIKSKDLAFLTSLKGKLVTDEKYIIEATKLSQIVDRLNTEKEIINGKTAAAIAEKRRADYLYARTPKEREQILSRKKQPPKKVCDWQVVATFKQSDGSDFEEIVSHQPTKHEAHRFIKMHPELVDRYDSVCVRKHFIKEVEEDDKGREN